MPSSAMRRMVSTRVTTDPQVLLQRQSPEDSTPLRQYGYSETHQLVGRPAGDRDTFIKDLAMARRQHPAQGFERRGLARAVRANQADQFAAAHCQVNAFDRADSSVGHLQSARLQGTHATPPR